MTDDLNDLNDQMPQHLSMWGVHLSAQMREHPSLHLTPAMGDLPPRTTRSTQVVMALSFKDDAPVSPEEGHPYLVGASDLERLRDLLYFAEQRGMFAPLRVVDDRTAEEHLDDLLQRAHNREIKIDLQQRAEFLLSEVLSRSNAHQINAELAKRGWKLSFDDAEPTPEDAAEVQRLAPYGYSIAYRRGRADGIAAERKRFTTVGKPPRVTGEPESDMLSEPVATDPGPTWPKVEPHLADCYRGEYADSCKYHDDDCPAKPKSDPDWSNRPPPADFVGSRLLRWRVDQVIETCEAFRPQPGREVMDDRQWLALTVLNILAGKIDEQVPPSAPTPPLRGRKVVELVEALRLTVEYVGLDVLAAEPGWSWYDALSRHAPDVLKGMLAQMRPSDG